MGNHWSQRSTCSRSAVFSVPNTHSKSLSMGSAWKFWLNCSVLGLKLLFVSAFSFCHFLPLLLPFFFLKKKTVSNVSQTGLELCIQQRMTLNFWSSCLCVPSAGFTGVHHNAQVFQYWRWSPGFCACYKRTLQTRLYPQSLLCLSLSTVSLSSNCN